ncbi:MAG: Uma2 family endonuclease [Rhodothermales bacterium]
MPSLAEKQRLFTADEYHALGKAGILTEDDRVELIDGQIIAMSPIGSYHAAIVNRITHLLTTRLYRDSPPEAVISVQNPVRLSDHTEPEPDVVLLHPRPDFYASRLPGPQDVLLLVEVADTTLAFDREVKLPRYAAAGIPEVWIVALEEDRVDVYRQPGPSGYAEGTVLGRGEQVQIEALPDVGSFEISDMLG